MRIFTCTLSNGNTMYFHYDPNPQSPGGCVTMFTGEQDFSRLNEFLDAMLGIYSFHARQTGKAFTVKWSLPSGRKFCFEASPDKTLKTVSPDTPPTFCPEQIRAQIAAKITPERMAELVGKLPEEGQRKVVRTYFAPRPTKRSQRITVEKAKPKP
jgi:hypothetical protein